MHSPTRKRGRPQWPFIMVIVFLALAAWLYLPDILFSGPRGIHFIRQTDSIAFLMNYGRPSWDFLAPAVYDLRNAPDGGWAAAEFPVLYYLMALLKQMFGTSYMALRPVNLTIVLAGHFLLARIAATWLGSAISGLGFSLWMLSSSVVLYYAANFLPDAAAYGCILAGLCLVLDGRSKPNWRKELAGAGLLVMGGLLKAPAALYLLGYGCVLLFSKEPGKRRKLAGVLAGTLFIIAWNLYAIRYNARHQTHYFMTWAEPIWDMSGTEIGQTWKFIREYWWTKYHHPTSWHVFAALLLSAVFLGRRLPAPVRPLLAWWAPAILAYLILFFRKFTDHDYYFLTVAPFLAFAALAGLSAIREQWLKGRSPMALALPLLLMACMGIRLGKLNLERRYNGTDDPHVVSTCLNGTVAEALAEAHIPQDARFIVLGDPTPNGSLLFLDRKGWTYDGAKEYVPPLDSLVRAGADHLLTIGIVDQDLRCFDLVRRTPQWALFRVHGEERGKHGTAIRGDAYQIDACPYGRNGQSVQAGTSAHTSDHPAIKGLKLGNPRLARQWRQP